MSSLLSRKPPTMSRLPKPLSIVVVIETALPSASTIDEVAGAGQLLAVVGCQQRRLAPGRVAGGRLLHRGVEPDLLRAGGEIALVEQARQRHADEVGVGEVEVAVGEGELGGLEQRLEAVGRRAERRPCRNARAAPGSAAPRRRPSSADPCRRPRRRGRGGRPARAAAHDSAARSSAGHRPGVDRRVAHGRHQRVADPAAIEGCAALGGDRAQGLRRSRDCAASCRPARGAAVGAEEVGAGGRERREVRRHCPAMAPARRGEISKPRSASSAAGVDQSAQGRRPCSRCASSSSASVPGTPTERPPGRPPRRPSACRRASRNRSGPAAMRRRLAPVEGGQLPRLGVPVEQERAAADARGLRLDQIQRELGRDHRIDRAAAAAQYRAPPHSVAKGVGGDDHEPLSRSRRAVCDLLGDVEVSPSWPFAIGAKLRQTISTRPDPHPPVTAHPRSRSWARRGMLPRSNRRQEITVFCRTTYAGIVALCLLAGVAHAQTLPCRTIWSTCARTRANSSSPMATRSRPLYRSPSTFLPRRTRPFVAWPASSWCSTRFNCLHRRCRSTTLPHVHARQLPR